MSSATSRDRMPATIWEKAEFAVENRIHLFTSVSASPRGQVHQVGPTALALALA